MELKKIIETFEKRVPLGLQEGWDHSGLQLGSKRQQIKSVLFSLDICKEVLREAKKKKCQLIVTHHPFRMSAPVCLDLDSYQGEIVAACVQNKIALYAAHTNYDACLESLNFQYLWKLGLQDIRPLSSTPLKLYKIAVFVPKTHTNKVMDALFGAGAGHIGHYDECSFRLEGTGTFKGDEYTNPAIGKKHKREEVAEERVEVIVKESDLPHVVAQMKKAHPYEEVAYDIYLLANHGDQVGIGAIGVLPRVMTQAALVARLKKIFKARQFRFVTTKKKTFKKIAICTGGGASLMKAALAQKADLFITGDLKYHEAIDAKRGDLAIADLGHFHTEKETGLYLKGIFEELFGKQLKYSVYSGLKDVFEFV